MPTREFVPYLSVTDAKEAVVFYSRVFETEPALLLNMPDGRVMHCGFRFGDARFLTRIYRFLGSIVRLFVWTASKSKSNRTGPVSIGTLGRPP